ncbi:protocatechuate 3,4-dioxygenase subunit alpha [Inquilinus sp. CAU 1745]|uniref:protocatechuate 3,4-dioxygenase subunit alpha n=1 Tax=Inquilinus sp. CAU 1745 TaxID=3140369 RepID=UPI00325AAB00
MLNRLPPLKETPSQTGGPYVHIGLTPCFAEIEGVYPADPGAEMTTPETVGDPILVTGRIFDGSGAPVTDAVIEIWQADSAGAYDREGSAGWGRQATNGEGRFRFVTVKPGRVSGPDGRPMAPHLSLWITARGINIGLHTRLYFGDEEAANEEDSVLARIPDPRRRKTLIAARSEDGGRAVYSLDIRLQGEDETVFFDI